MPVAIDLAILIPGILLIFAGSIWSVVYYSEYTVSHPNMLLAFCSNFISVLSIFILVYDILQTEFVDSANRLDLNRLWIASTLYSILICHIFLPLGRAMTEVSTSSIIQRMLRSLRKLYLTYGTLWILFGVGFGLLASVKVVKVQDWRSYIPASYILM